MRCLIFVSFFLCLFASCSSSKKITSNETSATPFWTAELRDSVQKNNFQITFSTPKATITGICIVKQMNGVWKGTIINEFGVKVLDFVSNAKECKLLNVIHFLNKWYIKKTVAADIQFLMEVDNSDYSIGIQTNRFFVQDTLVVNGKKEKELHRFPDGEVKLINHKRDITYSLRKI